MAGAKDIIIKPIKAGDANRLIKRLHYSGKVVPNSKLHFGAFYNGRLEGALSFGPPIDKRRMINLVSGSKWHSMVELNRMAFSDRLPRNSESRALSVCFRIIRKAYPQIEWIVSFADATQCGDGAIYRASGFVLTQINKNTRMLKLNNGEVVAYKSLHHKYYDMAKFRNQLNPKPIDGFQIRYVYFLNPSARERLTVPEMPFSKIAELGAGMYKGEKRTPVEDRQKPSDDGGANPTRSLHSSDG